jgi:DUF4097 and DUF4098 domain-containing protein YvlB
VPYCASGKSFRFDYQKIIEISGDIELVISNSYGDVIVTGAPVNTLTINAVKNVRATDAEEAENITEHIEIKAKRQNRRVSIKTRYLRMSGRAGSFWDKLLGTGQDSFGDVDFEIIAPNNCCVDIDNTSGEITISGVTGDIRVVGSSGKIIVEEIIGDLNIESTSGDIRISNIRGQIDISSASSSMELNSITGSIDIRSMGGDKKGSFISGSVIISQTSGEVELKSLNGDLRVKSTSGSVYVEQESGAVDISTYTGNVNVKTELYSDRNSFIETSSGDVVFTIPEMSSGSVKLETVSGEIKTEMPMSIKSLSKKKMTGDFGKDGPKISLITSSGDITIGQY